MEIHRQDKIFKKPATSHYRARKRRNIIFMLRRLQTVSNDRASEQYTYSIIEINLTTFNEVALVWLG